MANNFFGTSLKDLAATWLKAKAPTRKAILAHAQAQSKRKAGQTHGRRWANAAAAMAAGDTTRMKAYAGLIDWADVKTPAPAKPEAKAASPAPKAKASPKAKATAKASTDTARMDAFETRLDNVENSLGELMQMTVTNTKLLQELAAA